MVTDAVAICLALFAMWIAERPATIKRTFGFHRLEVLVVMFNALALWVLATGIFYEAYQRLGEHAEGHGHEVEGGLILSVAIAGLAIILLAAWTLSRSSRHSITVEGAFWHIMADLMGSVVVVISGLLTLLFRWELVDPILGILMAALILITSCRLAIKVFRVLLENVPLLSPYATAVLLPRLPRRPAHGFLSRVCVGELRREMSYARIASGRPRRNEKASNPGGPEAPVAYPGWPERLLISGPPNGKFAIQSY